MPETTIRTTAEKLARALTAAHAHADTDDWVDLNTVRIDVRAGRARIIGTDRYTLGVADPGGTATGDDLSVAVFADDVAHLVADVERIAALAPDAEVAVEIDLGVGRLDLTAGPIVRTYELAGVEGERLLAIDWAGILRGRAAEARTDGAAPLINPALIARFAAARREVGDMIHTITFGALPTYPDIARGSIVTVDTWLAGAVMGCNPLADDTVPRPAADVVAALTTPEDAA